jgi:hypothetical protein
MPFLVLSLPASSDHPPLHAGGFGRLVLARAFLKSRITTISRFTKEVPIQIPPQGVLNATGTRERGNSSFERGEA